MTITRRLHKRAPGDEVVPAPGGDDHAARDGARAELEWKYRIHERLLKTVDLTLMGALEEPRARAQIREVAQRLIVDESVPLPAVTRQRIIKQIEDEILGLGPLEPLMADATVSDILVNGFDSVYVERRGRIERTEVRFRDNAHLMNIIDRIVSRVGRRIDESSPMVDARLRDGSRVNAIIPPLAIDGPSLSIRRFAVERLGMDDLIGLGSLTAPIAEVLAAVVRGKLNVLISGGTGSGKTTLLNILSGFIPPAERIVSIEDSAELQLQQPHVVRLETRPSNIEHKGEVTQRDLVRNSLRMRPDRIIVGEVRAAEAFDMLQAMNTGHDGSLTTVHANTPRDALSRLENMITMAGLSLPIAAMRAQIASAIHVILQLERMEDGGRRVVSVQEIQGMEGDVVTTSEIFKFQRRGVDDKGKVLGDFMATGLVPRFHEHLRRRGIELDFALFNPDSRGKKEK
ncbi:MAG TPA: CpaF family protein [Sulfuricaulis sp.]|nr:CpaF family protein [Sulfuricaulis sp.]